MNRRTQSDVRARAESQFKKLFHIAQHDPIVLHMDAVEMRRLIFPAKYRLSNEYFDAVANAARTILGERESFVLALEALPDDELAHVVSLDDSADYDHVAPVDMANCVFSTSGIWGVYLSGESYGLIGGPREMLSAVEERLPGTFSSHEQEFVAGARAIFGRGRSGESTELAQ